MTEETREKRPADLAASAAKDAEVVLTQEELELVDVALGAESARGLFPHTTAQ